MMTKQQSIYASRSRRRGYHDAAAIQKSWIRMDVLRAYVTPDGDLVVIGMDDTLHATVAEAVEIFPPVENPVLVEPADIAVGDLGTRWEAARGAFGNKLAELDLTTIDRGKALASFEKATATLLRAVEILRETSGPDWRERIGL